jgi:hypothetical protein
MSSPTTIMNNNEVSKILNLENAMEGLQGVFIFMILAVIIIIILYVKYPDVFVPKFGYSFILTVILIFIFIGLWNFYSNFKNSNPNATLNEAFGAYSSLTKIGGLLVIIGLIIGIVSLLGVFTTPFKNNLGLLINYIIILVLLIGTAVMFKKSSTNDAAILEKMPMHIQKFYTERKKFMMIFVVFVLIIIGLYLYNPSGFMTKYGGAPVFISIFIGIILLLIIKGYDAIYTDPIKANVYKEYWKNSPNLFKMFKGLYVVIGLVISAAFFYWMLNALGIFDQNEDKSSKAYIIKVLVNLAIFMAIFTLIYKTVNAGGYFSNNPLFRLIFNTILYIPCLLVVILDFIVDLFKKKPTATATETAVTAATTLHGATTAVTGESKSLIVFGNTTKNDLIFFGTSVTVCGLYLLFNYIIIPYGMNSYYKQGGTQLVNNPIPTDKLTNVATYENLNGSDSYNYRYALSFWFYIDSFPPSTSTSYLKSVPILSYGDNPTIKYYAPTNSLIITVKQKSENPDIVSSIQKLETNIKAENIEKWNEIQNKIKSGVEMVKNLPIGNEDDENGNRIIYKRKDILLQKWNNIVLNYNGGTLDVFYNGELVKSAIEVVPKISKDMLTVGTENGISGNVANILYFDHQLNYLTVNRLYTMLKDKNPPTISTIDQTLIPLPNEY